MSAKDHKRAETYEGPQMNFRFPSDEDFHKDSTSSALEGPKVAPYYRYEKGKSRELSAPQILQHIPVRSKDKDRFYHPPSQSGPSDYSLTSSHIYTFSFESSEASSASIPTQSNISEQITSSTGSIHGDPSSTRSATVIRHGPFSVRSGSIRRNTSVAQRRQMADTALRNSAAPKRTASIRTSKRCLSVQSEDDKSLYEKSSVKRSKAVKYTVGWLTRLRLMGSKMGKKLKSWRLISFKKAFQFKRLRSSRMKKSKISMPLERGRAQSISELRRAIDDWATPNDISALNNVLPPPPQQYRVPSSTLMNAVSETMNRMPPPLPPHRIASNMSMQRVIDEQEKRSASGRYIADSPPALREPLDQVYNAQQQQEKSLHYPSHPPTVYDDEDDEEEEEEEDVKYYEQIPDGIDVCLDEDNYADNDEDEDDEDEDEEQEQALREYWRHYLRTIVANRIESKLELYRLSQIPEPERAEEYAEEVFGSLSDLDDASSDFDSHDTESLTSVSSTDISESSSVPSISSTTYFSAYDEHAASTPLDLVRYQMAYIARYRDVEVKRASTLPIKNSKETRHNAFELQGLHRARFLSVVR